MAAAGQQLHGAVVDLLVAAHGVLNGAAGLGEGWRVEDDKVVGVALFFQPGQQIKGVLAEEVHVVKAVALGIPFCHRDGLRADVGGGNAGCPALGRVQSKAAGVSKAVQHRVPRRNAGHGAAIVLLVEEEAGLLAVLKIDVVENAVLADLGLGGGRVRFAGQLKPALVLLQPLFGAQGFVVALIDAVDGLAVGPQHFCQDREEHGLELFHPNAQGLGDEDAAETVHGQAGELVGLTEDDAACGQVVRLQHGLAVAPRILGPAPPEGRIEGIIGVAGDEPDADLALQRNKTGAEVGTLGADHIGEGAVFGLRLRAFEDVVLVHPRVAAHQQPLSVFVDFVDGIIAGRFHKTAPLKFQFYFIIS